jgi:hypothetical protein
MYTSPRLFETAADGKLRRRTASARKAAPERGKVEWWSARRGGSGPFF